MTRPKTLFGKIWDGHSILSHEDGQSLLWVDRHFLHEGSFNAFDQIRARGGAVARPELSLAVTDHYAPTRGRESGVGDPAIREIMQRLAANTKDFGIPLIGLHDRRQGIVHVVGPERGLTLPGLLIVCGDSHTSTHGALGAIGLGIGASEAAHVLMTQTLWQRRPKLMRVCVTGKLVAGASAKDVALAVVARLGADGGRHHAIEYAGDTIRALSIEGRLTLCNMSIECGARCGMVAPDEKTIDYLRGRPDVPSDFEVAAQAWRCLPSDADAAFDREVTISGAEVAPFVTWGTSPEDALPIVSCVPDPERIADAARADHARDAIAYMGLHAGQRLQDIAVDRVFIGSCTNSRIEDLRAAAWVLAGRHARVPGMVSPGSGPVKRQAEEEGLHLVFIAAGLDWVDAGCSMCVGMNGDLARPGERCASTTNRNFVGRQGPGARTHLMSPAMAAAAAIAGRLHDVRPMLVGRDC